jgi:transposase
MLTGSEAANVYLACGATDMRKSIDGLAAIVTHAFDLNPFEGASLFVFCNKGRNKLKILRWENNGFWLYYRRLERGRFRWPQSPSGEPMTVSRRQLAWLLDGLSIEQLQAHKPLATRVAS